MTDSTALHIVALYDTDKGKRAIIAARKGLLTLAVRHVREGTEGTRADRLREATEWSGVLKNLIEIEAGR